MHCTGKAIDEAAILADCPLCVVLSSQMLQKLRRIIAEHLQGIVVNVKLCLVCDFFIFVSIVVEGDKS